MKKQYVAPMADKVDFDYEENVVASGSKKQGCDFDWTPPSCGTTNYNSFSLIDLGIRAFNSFLRWISSWR